MFEEALKNSKINLFYGKLCETKRKGMILRDAEETTQNIIQLEIETYKTFSEDVAALTWSQTKSGGVYPQF